VAAQSLKIYIGTMEARSIAQHPVTLCSIVLVLCVNSFAQTSADYFLIADPQHYTVYDQYQQPLSAADMSLFAPYAPFQIMERDVVLGDQITHALKFMFRQRTFYLLKDDEHRFIGEKNKTDRQSFNGCAVLEDTVDVVGNGLSVTTGAGKSFRVAKGERLNRVFRNGQRYYVAAIGEHTRYGWSSLEPKSAWRKSASRVVAETGNDISGFSETLKQRILNRFSVANESYKACFSHFNTLTRDEKVVPQWRCECSGFRIRCELSGPYSTGDQLLESSQYLAQDIENILVGTGFGVVCKSGEMIIEKRAGSN
jgi:hypothetical protein